MNDWKIKFLEYTANRLSLKDHHIATPLNNIINEPIRPFLSPYEKLWIRESITKPYIFIHPYSSIKDKRVDSFINLECLIDKSIFHGFDVVLVGKSFDFGDQTPFGPQVEEFPILKNGLFNFTYGPLKKIYSSRLGAELALLSHKFVVSNSAYYQILKWQNKPGLVFFGSFLENEYRKRFNKDHWFYLNDYSKKIKYLFVSDSLNYDALYDDLLKG
jgi:hypothetical protein